MSYNVVLTRSFKHSVERLKKRFRHVKDDVRLAVEVLLQSPRLGVPIPGGSGIRKLRVPNSDLTKGKSGGYRLLYCVRDHPGPQAGRQSELMFGRSAILLVCSCHCPGRLPRLCSCSARTRRDDESSR